MNEPSAPYHAHVYYEARTRAVAERLHQQLDAMRANGVLTSLLFVGEMRDKSVGPHPKPQFEVHFLAAALKVVIPLLSSSGLTILVHPLTQDDVADHTTLAQWIGEPLALDETVLDPPARIKAFLDSGRPMSSIRKVVHVHYRGHTTKRVA